MPADSYAAHGGVEQRTVEHRHPHRFNLPAPSTRRWNEGVLQTASKNTPLNDPIALFEDYSEVDKELCRIQNDPDGLCGWTRT